MRVSKPHNSSTCDVAICGGGLAGQTLARQLKLANPQIDIVVIDSLARPLPEAAFKVGESITEVGAFYLAHVLDLVDYFEREHITKLGFRFFFGDASGAFEERPEFGLSNYPSVISTYQFDRGQLENDLRKFNVDAGIRLLEGWSVRDIELGSVEEGHRVSVKSGSDGEEIDLRCRWVVDAMGRRRFLQRKLGLTVDRKGQCSAAWFRFDDRIDVSDFVPRHVSGWHERVAEDRYHSTNHLVGYGYWVWIIPLSNGGTSIGIVTKEDIHPPAAYRTYELASEWLQRYEPALAAHLQNRSPLDFRWIHKYSYSSEKIYSSERWSCIGESAVFPDPLYAPGTDLIAFGNTITAHLIDLDRKGELEEAVVNKFNMFIRAFNDVITDTIQVGYEIFARPNVIAAKIIWDTAVAWSVVCPQMFNSIFLDPEKEAAIRQESSRFFEVTLRMQRLFAEWGDLPPGRLTFDFINFLEIPMLRGLRQRNMRAGKTAKELASDYRANMAELEELAQAIFRIAVSDVLPSQLDRISHHGWLNYSGFTLQSAKWDTNGLFAPRTPARDFAPMMQSLTQFFQADGAAMSFSEPA